MHRLFVAMTTLAALAVVLHPSPSVSAARINVNIGSVTWFLGDGIAGGNTNGRGHAARFALPEACAFTNNGSLLIVDIGNDKIRRVVQPRDDLVEDWMGNGAFADVNGVGTAASYKSPLDIAVMANNTFAFVVEGHAISQIDIAASLKSAFVGVSSASGTDDGSGTAARFRDPLCITIFHATTTLFVGEFPRVRQVSRAGDVSMLSGDTSSGFVDGNSATARYNGPQGITTAQSALILFVTDSHAIRRVSSTGTCLTIAGSTSQGYEDGPAATAEFRNPAGVDLDKFEQSLYIADRDNHVVRRLDLTTMMVYTVIGTGDFDWTSAPISYNAAVFGPAGLCIDPVSQRLFVTGPNSLSFAEVYTLTTTGSLVTSTSKTGTNTPSLTASTSKTGTNSLSLAASTSETGTNSLSLTASTSKTRTNTPSLAASTSKTGTNTLALAASTSKTGTNTLSLTASTSKTGTATRSITDTVSTVNCDVQFCVCVGVHSDNLTAVQCAHHQGNCTNTRLCTELYEECVVDALAPLC
jgi:hypothetical protein